MTNFTNLHRLLMIFLKLNHTITHAIIGIHNVFLKLYIRYECGNARRYSKVQLDERKTVDERFLGHHDC